MCPCRSRPRACKTSSSSTAAPSSITSPAKQDDSDDCVWEVVPSSSESTRRGSGKPQTPTSPRSSVTEAATHGRRATSDPQAGPDSGPCFGQHVPVRRANQHAQWTTCSRCRQRLSYDPAPARSSQDPLDLVVEALGQLQLQCEAANVTAEKALGAIALTQSGKAPRKPKNR